MSAESKKTHNHKAIKKWVEDRGGRPAKVKGTETPGSALLRIDFGAPEISLEEISWDEFFEIFEKNKLAFLYQEKTADGGTSRFFKFVTR